MSDNTEQVLQVIREYIQRKKGLRTMERIHRRVFDEEVSFTMWSDVEEKYEEIEFDNDLFEEFLLTSKDLVEGGFDRISEAYFDIERPDDVTTTRLTEELGDFKYDEEGSDSEDRDGFQFNDNDNGEITGSYIHTDVETNITAAGEVRELVSEDSVDFRILPDDELVIVETTYPPDVQRMKGAFGKTDIAVTVCGSLTSNFSEANERVEAFRDSFPHHEPGNPDPDIPSDVPKRIEVKSVKLTNPEREEEERIDKIDVEGDQLTGHPLIQERLDEDYVMRGLVIRTMFENELFDIAFSGSDMMGYAKVEDIGDYSKGQRLMLEVRERFMNQFR